MKRILVVAEDPDLQEELQRNLQSPNKSWECHFVSSGRHALQTLAAADYCVLVSDLTLPDMRGGELLERAKLIKPDIARILLAEPEHLDEVLRSSGSAHQFLARPCDAKHLLSSIERTCRIRSLLNNRIMRQVTGGLECLPSLPELYHDLSAEMAREEECSLKRIAGIVVQDIAMSAKILQLASSAYFGLSRTVHSAEQAVMLLGAEAVRSIVLLETLGMSFPSRFEVLGQDWLWQHSFAVADAARAIAASEGGGARIQSQAYQAGVLHDIGKLVLASNFPVEYLQAVKLAGEEALPISAAEQRIFECDHGQVGAYLLGLWGLPDSIVEAVAFHHVPVIARLSQQEMTPLVAVYGADLCVDQCEDAARFHAGPSASEGLAQIGRFSRYDRWMQIVAAGNAGNELFH